MNDAIKEIIEIISTTTATAAFMMLVEIGYQGSVAGVLRIPTIVQCLLMLWFMGMKASYCHIILQCVSSNTKYCTWRRWKPLVWCVKWSTSRLEIATTTFVFRASSVANSLVGVNTNACTLQLMLLVLNKLT